jgi:hypothetical protein
MNLDSLTSEFGIKRLEFLGARGLEFRPLA